ncbi:MAG: hypothetical protein DME22_05925 [Verrucomicrobia bacterium]|nr:MAG: hypothetical protein DME22_05925 [Verrucomicrobiota bacterium]PYK02687.1 MAG: hypothetical protein DME23_01150 [Verrucomicrobiota bacterium]
MKTIRCILILVLCSQLAAFPLRAHPDADTRVVAEEMAAAANNLLATLTPEQAAQATYPQNDNERFNWHFIPRERKGLPFKEMAPEQKHLAHALLSTALSHRGYLKASTIMSLEQVLRDLEQGKGPPRDPERYFVTIFGRPDAKATWGWRVEGHHLSLNFMLVEGKEISVTPSFLGSNPGEVREGPRKGLRVLGAEEDLARQLVSSLNDEQKKAAIYTNTAPREIITGNDRKARALSPMGIPAAKLNAAQTELVWQLIREYVYRYRPEIADHDLKKIEQAGTKNLYFAWAGSTEPKQGHYYRVQGPTFLMEYDNTQNDANHIHAVWRDFEHDFGDDLLREHYERTPHPK